MRTSIERDRRGINYPGKWEAWARGGGGGGMGGEKEEKGRLIYKKHLSFVSALLCRLHFVINFSLLICNILATLYMLNFSNNAFSKSQSIRLSHFLMNVFTLGKPEYFLPTCVTASSIKFVTSI